MKYRIFHNPSSRRRLKVTDVDFITSDEEKTVYHTDGEDFKAIRVTEDEAKEDKILLSDGSTTETRVKKIMKKDYNYKQYIVGFGYYATSAEVGFYGEHDNKLEHEWSTTKVRTGDGTVVHGTADYDNEWEWKVEQEAPETDVQVIESGELSDVFNGSKYVVISSEVNNIKPIDVFRRVSD